MTTHARKWLKFRITTVAIVFVVLFIALVSRAFQLQILSGDALKARADRQHTRVLALQPERGLILDRDGKVLAASLMVDSVYADPSRIKDTHAVAAKLSRILDINRRSIQHKLQKYKHFCWISRKISPEQSKKIRTLKRDGIYFIKEPKRFYTNKGLASHLLGCVGIDSEGLEGLELKYDRYLKKAPRKVIWGKDARGQQFYLEGGPGKTGENSGYNLILTLDSRMQHIVESELHEAAEKTGADNGIAVVMDPKTGEILAMASTPGFNPTVFSKYSADVRRNRIITDCFDPGSIFKPFLVAAALEEGVVDEAEVFDCGSGSYRVGDRIIHEAQGKKYENLTTREILKYSSNIGSVQISEKLGKKQFSRYIEKFGFGSKTGIDLPGEVSGIVRRSGTWTDVDTATIAFGQGISVTAIQMISAMSALANNGVLIKPHVVRGIVDTSGRVIREFTPTRVRQVVSPMTAQRITSMLVDVVGDHDGTGKNANIIDVSVAGKTGTSQKFDFEKKRYSSRRVKASFLGFLPAEDPRMVILVVLDEPKTHRWGGRAAAPVFRKISEQILRRFDRDGGMLEYAADDETFEVAHVVAREAHVGDLEMNRSTMPDFRGLTMREVLKIARFIGLDVKIKGSGWAVSQKPAPGTVLGDHMFCKVIFNPGL